MRQAPAESVLFPAEGAEIVQADDIPEQNAKQLGLAIRTNVIQCVIFFWQRSELLQVARFIHHAVEPAVASAVLQELWMSDQ